VDFRGELKPGHSVCFPLPTSQIRPYFLGAGEEHRYYWLGSQQDIVHRFVRTGHGFVFFGDWRWVRTIGLIVCWNSDFGQDRSAIGLVLNSEASW